MKFTTMILAAGLLAVPGIALAQTLPQTASSPGKESTMSPTEKVQPPGNIRANPTADSTSTMKMKKSHHMAKGKSNRMTTGSKPTAVPLNSTSGTGKKP
jgi:hypothetical protein